MKKGDLARLTGISVHLLRRWSGDLMSAGFYKNQHSWNGSGGFTGTLYRKTGEVINLPYGGWGSDNGTILWEEDEYPVPLALVQAGAVPGDVLVLRDWKDWIGSECHSYTFYKVLDEDFVKECQEWVSSLENEEA